MTADAATMHEAPWLGDNPRQYAVAVVHDDEVYIQTRDGSKM
jgi:hypothetical protein